MKRLCYLRRGYHGSHITLKIHSIIYCVLLAQPTGKSELWNQVTDVRADSDERAPAQIMKHL